MAGRIKFVTLWLCLACVIVFVLQFSFQGFTEMFMLTPNALSMPWQFLTAVFLHGSIIHLIYNLFALFLFGLILESVIGSRKFLLLFLAAGIIANIASFPLYPSSLGASGAIMAIMGCLAILRPMMTIWAFNLPMPMFIAAIIWAAGSFLGIFGFGDQGIGYLAHLSGIFLGVLYGLFLRLGKKHSKENNSVIFQRRIVIPEDSMRRWEDHYMKR